MKTEKEIKDSLEKVKVAMSKKFDTAINEFEAEEYDSCLETLFTLTVNIAALEAGTRLFD